MTRDKRQETKFFILPTIFPWEPLYGQKLLNFRLSLEFCNPVAFVTMEFEESRYDRRNAKEKEYLIDDLKDEVSYLKEKNKQYKFREEGFENEMDAVTLEIDNLKRELDFSRKESMETKDILAEMENLENEELEVLEIKHKNALKDLAKKEGREKEFIRAKSISDQVLQTMKEETKKLELEINELPEKVFKDEVTELNLKYDLLKAEAEKDKEYIVILKCEVDNLQLENEENKMIIQTIKEEKKVMKDKLDMKDFGA